MRRSVARQFSTVGPQCSRILSYFAAFFVDDLDVAENVADCIGQFARSVREALANLPGSVPPALLLAAGEGDADPNRRSGRNAKPNLCRIVSPTTGAGFFRHSSSTSSVRARWHETRKAPVRRGTGSAPLS